MGWAGQGIEAALPWSIWSNIPYLDDPRIKTRFLISLAIPHIMMAGMIIQLLYQGKSLNLVTRTGQHGRKSTMPACSRAKVDFREVQREIPDQRHAHTLYRYRANPQR